MGHVVNPLLCTPGAFFFYLKHVWGRANSRDGGLFNLEKIMVSILHETLNVRAVKTSRDPCQSHNPYSTLVGSLSNDVFERRTSTGCGLFALFSRDFEQILGQNVPLRVAWDHALSLLSLYVSHGKRALFFSSLEPKKQRRRKKKNAWSQVTLRVKTLSNTNLVVSRYIQKKRKTLTSGRRASLKHAAA